jgi:hypothetical protein
MLNRRLFSETEPDASVGLPRPTLRSVAPRWAALADKYAELMRRADEIGAEMAQLLKVERVTMRIEEKDPNGKLRGTITVKETIPLFSSELGSTPLPPPPVPEPSAKVVSILGKLLPNNREKPAPVVGPIGERRARVNALTEELEAVREAIKLIEPEIRAAHLEGSADLCRALAPEYQIVADRVTRAIVELGEAAIEHENWLKELRLQGAASSMLRPVLVSALDERGDPIARLRRLLEWAAEGGWFARSDIPGTWRART